MIVIDLEATGLDHDRCSIVSIAAMEFENTKHVFYEECQIFEDALIINEAMEMIGFTMTQLRDINKLNQRQILRKFLKFIYRCEERTFISLHPCGLDIPILEASLKREKLGYKLFHKVIDLYSVYIAISKRLKIEPVIERNHITNGCFTLAGLEENKKGSIHNALFDVKLTAESFSRLVYGKNLLEEFNKYPIPNYLKIS